jgi:hypothetical protein
MIARYTMIAHARLAAMVAHDLVARGLCGAAGNRYGPAALCRAGRILLDVRTAYAPMAVVADVSAGGNGTSSVVQGIRRLGRSRWRNRDGGESDKEEFS